MLIDVLEVVVSRLQLALNVSDLQAAVDFYTTLFGTPPAKIRSDYANFAIDDPPLKLVLMQQGSRTGGVQGALNHLGVEVNESAAVLAASERLAKAGLSTTEELSTTCCYAHQDKVWVDDPDETPWEVYTVLADADSQPGDLCCQTVPPR